MPGIKYQVSQVDGAHKKTGAMVKAKAVLVPTSTQNRTNVLLAIMFREEIRRCMMTHSDREMRLRCSIPGRTEEREMVGNIKRVVVVESWESELRWGAQLWCDHLVRSPSSVGHDLFFMTLRYEHVPVPQCPMFPVPHDT